MTTLDVYKRQVKVLLFIVNVEVVVSLEIIGEEAHAAFHCHQLGAPGQGLFL